MRIFAKFLGLILASTVLLSSCTVIREGEEGVKRKLGTYDDLAITSGVKGFNPFTTTIIKVSTQTNNIEVEIIIPLKEGLSIRSEISILYSIVPDKAPDILRNIGPGYERNVIITDGDLPMMVDPAPMEE